MSAALEAAQREEFDRGVRLVTEAFAAGWRMPPLRTICEWAESDRILTPERAHQQGRYRVAITPYMREPMECLSSHHPCEKVVFMKCPQCGATECACNAIGAWAVDDPSGIMYCAPALDDTKKFIRTAVEPMIRDSPSVRAVFSAARAKNKSNTIYLKQFIGGALIGVGMNSPKGLAGSPVRRAIADDVDRGPATVDQEGDPLGLLWKRMLTFPNRKMFVISTPGKVEDESRIRREFLASDQRYYYIPCPHCGHMDILTWSGYLKFHDLEDGGHFRMAWNNEAATVEEKLDSIHAVCPECDGQIQESFKPRALALGKWRAHAVTDGRVVGFHLSGLYSPFEGLSWRRILEEFLVAKDDPVALAQWMNLCLAECWRHQPDSVKVNVILERREAYRAEVPNGVGVLVGAADVQTSYGLVYGIMGVGDREESWWIEYGILDGDPGDLHSKASPWLALDRIRNRSWEHESGRRMTLERFVVDLGGNHHHEVYQYCRARAHQKVYPIRGGNDPTAELVGKFSRKNPAKVRLYTLGVDSGKDTIHGRLKIGPLPGSGSAYVSNPGYIHVPKSVNGEPIVWANAEFAAQLTSEVKKRVRDPKRGWTRKWEKIYDQNEAWDLSVYMLAALRMLPAAVLKNLKTRAQRFAVPLEESEREAIRVMAAEEGVKPQPPPTIRRPPVRRGGGFVNRWRR
jgi:phage terminase large subunit GpA-like protein